MKLFVTGTGTDVGKTTICSWICLHTQYAYFKPIQTGDKISKDSAIVENLSRVKIIKELFSFTQPYSPHLAAKLDNGYINETLIKLPSHEENLIVEGAGGLMVPINEKVLMIDVIKQLNTPVILVATTILGTINHTLLSIEVLKNRKINVVGIILNGQPNEENRKAIEFYGGVPVLDVFPQLENINYEKLKEVPLGLKLQNLFKLN